MANDKMLKITSGTGCELIVDSELDADGELCFEEADTEYPLHTDRAGFIKFARHAAKLFNITADEIGIAVTNTRLQ